MATTRIGSAFGRGLSSRLGFITLVIIAVACACGAPLRAATTITWNNNSNGDWSAPGNWDLGLVPTTSAYDVVLPDIDLPGPGSREVTLDVPNVDVNSVLIQEYPYNPPPGPLIASPGDEPWDNILTLDQNLTVDTNLTLSGSRATLNLNGETINGPVVDVDAPVNEGGYWYRNRITGSAGTNDGTEAEMPSGTALGGYEGGFTAPNIFTPATLVTGGFTNPVGLTGSATTGTINAALNNQGLVWLNASPTLTGAVTNSGNFGYFRYDSSGNSDVINFSSTVTNTDPNDVVDLNGNSNVTGAVTNENGAYFYTRGATSFSNTLTNESGGQFLFQPTSTNPGKFFINQGITNEGTGQIGSPTGLSSPLLNLTTVSSYMDFDGDFIMGSTVTSNVNLVNQNSAVLVLQGNTRIGQVDQLPLGSKPDVISSLKNYSGGIATFQPTNTSTQDMEITGQIINDGTSAPGGDPTTLNLLGHTIVRGRTLASPIVTNTNGAVLNYNAFVQVGYDVQADGDITYQPQGNLNNDNGIINGYGSGNIIFYGGDQANGDASHTLSTINLYNTAQFTTGRQGSSTFTNYGSVNGVSGTPTFNSGIFDNYGTISVSNSALFTLTSSTAGAAAAVNNYGNIAFTTSGIIDTVGGIINYNTLTYSGGISEGGILTNDLGGTINATGGSINNISFNNDAGGIMNLGTGAAGALFITSSSLTQAGTINIATNFALVSTPAFTNSGTVNLNGLNSDLTAPGVNILNNGQITGTGLIGVADTFGGAANQVTNGAGTGGITVAAGGMSIGGALAPINQGSINIGSGSGLAIIGGAAGATFQNTSTGTITLGDAGLGVLTDAGTFKIFENDGKLIGHGTVTFLNGINNGGTIEATAPGMTLNGTVANADGTQIGTMNVDANATLAITSNFSNVGAINLDGATAALTDGGTASTFLNSGVHANLTVSGLGSKLAFSGGMTNRSQITINPGASLTLQSPLGGPLLPLTNSNSISLIGASSFTGAAINNTAGFVTATGPGATINTNAWNNTNGSLIVAGAGSTFTTNGNLFTNDGAFLDLAAGAVGTVGNITNNGAGGAIGSIQVNNSGSLTTRNLTNAGSITIANGSTVATNGGGGFSPFINNAGTVVVGGTSLFDVGVVTQNGGTITVGGGSAANTLNYTLTGGFLDLNNNSAVAGQAFTLTASVFTNSLGTLGMLNGATASVTQLVNGGVITVDSASTFTSAGIGGDTNLGSTISVEGGSTLTLGNLDNTGGTLHIAGSTATIGTLTNNNNGNLTGTLLADTGSTVNTGAITSAGSITVEGASTLKAGNGLANLTTSGTVTDSGTSFIDVLTLTQNGGTVAVNSGSALLTASYTLNGGGLQLNGNSAVAGQNFTLNSTTLTSNLGTIGMLNGATADVNRLVNGGSLTIDSGSNFKSNGIGGDTNLGSTITAENSSVLTLGALNNTGGVLNVYDSTATLGALTNNNNGQLTGTLLADDVATVNTGAIVSAGNITVQGGSVLTDGGGVGAFTTSGTVTVSGVASFLNVGTVTQNNGVVAINGGGSMFTTNYTNNGGSITANGASQVVGRPFTLDTFAFTNNLGTVSLLNAATADVTVLTNGGTITVDSGSTFQSAATGADTNVGSLITVDGGSTLTLGDLDNTGGTLNIAASTATLGVLTNNNAGNLTGTLVADSTSTVVTKDITSAGNITIQGASTLNTGAGDLTNNGVVVVQGTASTLTTTTFANNFGASLKLNGLSVVNVVTLLNAGDVNVDPGGVLTMTGKTGNDANTGTVEVSGAGSIMQTGAAAPFGLFTNTGGKMTVTEGGVVNFGIFFNSNAASSLYISDPGSAANLNSLSNSGIVTVDNTSTLTSAGVGGDSNIEGTIDVGGGSTLKFGNLNNTGGLLVLVGGSTGTIGNLNNNNGVGSTGEVSLDGASTLQTGNITSAGGLSVQGGSTLRAGGAGGLPLTTSGTITVSGAGSLLNVGATSQTAGTTAVNGGGVMWTLNYTNAGGITLNGPANVPGQSYTLRVQGTLTNNGQIAAENGATVNASVRFVNNGGSLGLDPGSSFTSAGIGGDTNVGGTINVTGASTITLGVLDNTDGLLSLTGASTADLDGITNNSVNATGTVLIDGASELDTNGADFANGGTLTVTAKSTLDLSGIAGTGDLTSTGGDITATGAGTTLTVADISLDTKAVMSVSQGAAIDSPAGGSKVTVSASSLTLADGLTLSANDLGFSAATVSVQNGTVVNNSGDLDNALGSQLNIDNSTVNNDGDITNSGTSSIAVNGSTLNGQSLTNSGDVNLGTGGVLKLDLDLTNNAGAQFSANGPLGSVTMDDLDNSGIFNAADGAKITIDNSFTNSAGAQATFNGGPNDTTVTAPSLNTDGSVLVENGSTIDLGAGFGALTVGATGSFSVIGDPSTALTGNVMSNGGEITVGNGAAMNTADFDNTGGSLTLDGNSAVAAPGFTNTLRVVGTLTNSGSISMLNGSTAVVNALVNTGLIAIDPGASLTSSGTTDSNSGSMTVTGTGSTFSTGGTFTNTGGTFEVSAGATAFIFAGGSKLVNGAAGNRTGSVTVDGAASTIEVNELSNFGSVTISNNGLLATDATGNDTNGGTISVTGNSATFNTRGGAFDNDSGVINVADTGLITTGAFTNELAGTVTVADNGSRMSVTSYNNDSESTITISNGASLSTIAALDTNDGTLAVTGGGTSVTSGGDLDNEGALTVANGARFNILSAGAKLNNGGGASIDGTSSILDIDTLNNFGAISVTNGGTLQTDGSGNDANSGAIAVDDFGSSFTTNGGTISNGSITVTYGATVTVGSVSDSRSILVTTGSTFTSSGSLTNSGTITVDASTMSVSTDFTNNDQALVSVTNGAHLNLNLVAGSTLTNNGTILVNGAGTKLSSGGVWDNTTLGVIEVANGANVDPPSLTTEGYINIDPLSMMTVESFFQSVLTSETIVDGMLTAPVTLHDGLIAGGGDINGEVENAGDVIPGGVAIPANLDLTVNDDYTQDSDGTLAIGIQSLATYNALDVLNGGTSTIDGGKLYLDLSPAYAPEFGDLFTVIDSPNGVVVNDDLDLVQSISYSNGYFETIYNPDNVQVEFVPEPTAGLLLLACGAAFVARRPRRAVA